MCMFDDNPRFYEEMTSIERSTNMADTERSRYAEERWQEKEYTRKLDETFEDIKHIIYDKYTEKYGKVDDVNIEMFIDSIWILAKCIERDWTIDFGFGKKGDKR